MALLWVITVGLGALVVWQLAEAVWGHRGAPVGKPRAAHRGQPRRSRVFGVLAWSAASIAASGRRTSKQPSLATVVFGLPGGPFLVGLVGVALVVGGGYAVYRGVTHAFLRDLDLRGAGLSRSFLVTRIGQRRLDPRSAPSTGPPGCCSSSPRSRFDPAQPAGLDAGLRPSPTQPYGPVVLVVLALGLGAFGVHCFFDARYRKA